MLWSFPSKTFQMKMEIEMLYPKHPNISRVLVFGWYVFGAPNTQTSGGVTGNPPVKLEVLDKFLRRKNMDF